MAIVNEGYRLTLLEVPRLPAVVVVVVEALIFERLTLQRMLVPSLILVPVRT